MKTKKQKREIIFVVVLCLFVLLGGYFFMRYGDQKNPHGRKKLSVDHQVTLNQSALQSFERSLNDFLRQVDARMQDYRNDRKVLEGLVRPENMRDPAYIAENYALAQEVIPSLRTQMDALLNVFDEKEKEVRAILANQPESARKRIFKYWKDMKNEQASAFVTYFTVEDEIIKAHEALIQFYYAHRQSITYDRDNNEVHFVNPEDDARAQALRQVIRNLKRQQSDALN